MNHRQFLKHFGPWAVVTGASSGIGREFAEQLAKMKFNVVLVSRRKDVLTVIGSELTKQYSIKTRSVALDLSHPNFLVELARSTADIDVGLVVSNAGADHMGAFLRIPLEDLQSMHRLNAASHLDVAHHFGSRFVESREKAGILFVSSTASLQATPLLANYAGSKAYVRTLGQALNSELRKTGIHSSVLIPGPTATPAFNERTDIDLKTMPMPPMAAAPVVRAGLQAIAKNKPYVIPGFMNSMMDFVGRKVMTRGMAASMWGILMYRAAPPHLKMPKRRFNSTRSN